MFMQCNPEEPFNLPESEYKVATFKYSSDKLLFENTREKTQYIDRFFSADIPFVVEWSRKEDMYDIQVIFPLIQNYSLNHYIIIIYLWSKNLVFMLGMESLTKYPPVWDRAMSFYHDYYDYFSAQNYINEFLEFVKLPLLVVDESTEKASVNLTKDPPDKIEKLISEGKSYSILTFVAEAYFKKTEKIS